jgi:hypothetical protein
MEMRAGPGADGQGAAENSRTSPEPDRRTLTAELIESAGLFTMAGNMVYLPWCLEEEADE